jgi:RNA polymerase-binding transcription factor DksA
MKNKGKTGERKKGLSEADLVLLQTLLVQRREEILNRVRSLEKDWQETSEPQIEAEEVAEELEITEPYAPLDEIERKEVRAIDLAIKKMDDGRYGICQDCGKPISKKRLKAIPWTPYCQKDSEKYDKYPSWFTPIRESGQTTPE